MFTIWWLRSDRGRRHCCCRQWPGCLGLEDAFLLLDPVLHCIDGHEAFALFAVMSVKFDLNIKSNTHVRQLALIF